MKTLCNIRVVLFQVVCCVALALPLHAAAQQKNGAHLEFECAECDLGEISRNDERLNHTFTFVNNGTEPLVILSATTTCSCLKAEFSRKPIEVGAKGEIKISIEPKKIEKGVFRRVVQIRSNSVGGTVILIVKGVAKD